MAITKHVYQIFIKATPQQVWDAIIEPSWTRRYFHGTSFDSPPAEGQPYRTSIGEGRPAIDGVIEELDPPNRLVMTWHVLYDAALAEEPPGRVEWIIEPMGEGLTRLRLEHGDLARSPLTWADVKDGWEYVLDGLKTVLETGESLPPMTVDLTPVEDAAGEWHRAQAIECNNSTWEMIQADRTPANDEEMLRRAYASTYHWASRGASCSGQRSPRSVVAGKGAAAGRATGTVTSLRRSVHGGLPGARSRRLRPRLRP